MQVHFDWPKLYASVLLERPVQEKLAQCAARLIEHDIRTEQRRAGEVLGSSGEIARRYGLGRETMLRSEEHTSELQSLMRISYAVFCLKKKIANIKHTVMILL